MYKLLIFLFLISIVVSCSIPENFGIPTWDTTFRAIFLNDIYNVEDVAEEDSSLVVINNILTYQDTISESQALNEFSLYDPETRFYDVSLQEIIPEPLEELLPWGEYFIVPEFDMDPNLTELDPYADFEEIGIFTGTIILELTNNTPVGYGNQQAGYPLRANIINTTTDEIMLSVIFDDIPADGGETTTYVDLDGLIIPNTLSIMIYGGCTGTNGEPCLIDDEFMNSTLDVNVDISDLIVDYVINAKIPYQEIDTISDQFDIDIEYPEIIGDFELLGYSEIIFVLNSVLPGNVIFDLTAENLSDSTQVFLQPYEGGGDHSFTLDIIAGETLINLNSNEYNINEFFSILPEMISYDIYSSIGDSTQYYTVYSTDEVEAEIQFSTQLQLSTGAGGIWILPREEGELKVSISQTDDFDQKIYDAFIRGGVHFDYLNETGVELGADIFIADNEQNLRDEIYNFVDPDTNIVEIINIPLLESTEGSTFKELEITIYQSDLDAFLADSIFIAPRLYLFSEGEFPLSNGVHLIGELFLTIRIDEDLTEDEDDN